MAGDLVENDSSRRGKSNLIDKVKDPYKVTPEELKELTERLDVAADRIGAGLTASTQFTFADLPDFYSGVGKGFVDSTWGALEDLKDLVAGIMSWYGERYFVNSVRVGDWALDWVTPDSWYTPRGQYLSAEQNRLAKEDRRRFEVIQHVTNTVGSIAGDLIADDVAGILLGDQEAFRRSSHRRLKLVTVTAELLADLAEHVGEEDNVELRGEILGHAAGIVFVESALLIATGGYGNAASTSARLLAKIKAATGSFKAATASKLQPAFKKFFDGIAQLRKTPDETAKVARTVVDDVPPGTAKDASHIGRLVLQQTCFVAGTPILTPEGEKTIESFSVGDKVLARPEEEPSVLARAQTVEAVFELSAPVLELQVGGQVIETTREHPFYVHEKGWTAAEELLEGDQLVGHDGTLTAVESVASTDQVKTVYNMRVSEDHTYFVGRQSWGFSLWVHNTYTVVKRLINDTWVWKLEDIDGNLTDLVFSSKSEAYTHLRRIGEISDARIDVLLNEGKIGQEIARTLRRTPDTAGTVWNRIRATQGVWPETSIPRSFELTTQNGRSIWVHGNATEHIAERVIDVVNQTGPTVRLGLGRIVSQSQLTSLEAAVNAATRNGIDFSQAIRIGGWELRFARPRNPGNLPALIHALPLE